MAKKNNYSKYAFYVILIAIVVRIIVFILAHPAGDSCYHLPVSRFIAEHKTIPFDENLGRQQVFYSPPLFHILSASCYIILAFINNAAAEIGLRLVSLLASIGLLFVTHRLVKHFYGDKTAFYAVFFVAFLPMSIYLSTISYVDMLLSFFITLSIYLVIKKKYLLAGFVAAAAMATKLNGLWILPLIWIIIYLQFAYNTSNLTSGKRKPNWKDILKDRNFINAIILFSIPALALGSIFYIRNYFIFSNPFWPFLNQIFGGPDYGYSYTGSSIAPLFKIEHITRFYLESYGVPDGRVSNLFYVNSSIFSTSIPVWFIGTIIFTIPLIISINQLFKKEFFPRICLYTLLAFIIPLILLLINFGDHQLRLLFPVIIVPATLWALGTEKIEHAIRKRKIKRKAKQGMLLFYIVLIVFAIGFSGAEMTKAKIAASYWTQFQEDFNWIKAKTPENAVIYNEAQCFEYNTNRVGFNYVSSTSFIPGSYIFVNPINNFSPLAENTSLEEINAILVYQNNKTGTTIYKITRRS